jgi:CDP-glucose 4,6-dehydratase
MFNFYKDKKVFITGHSGFKGSWLCKSLNLMGAKVTGHSLKPQEHPNLFELAEIENNVKNYFADIRDLASLKKAVFETEPDIIIHMAAQPLVRLSYKEPIYTYETNVLGTLNVLEVLRQCKSVKSFLNVTTDKVYKNIEMQNGYKETDELMGGDPYSNSKSCSELVTYSYKKSFFENSQVAISTARSGNVIGGGDFALDRIIPDAIRAIEKKETLIIRYPNSIRPYQFVLEALGAYLLIIKKQFEDINFQGSYNIGPELSDCIKTSHLIELFCKHFPQTKWEIQNKNEPHEAGFLKLDTTKIKQTFNWKPLIGIQKAVALTADWTKAYFDGKNIREIMDKQIHQSLRGGFVPCGNPET